MKLITLSLCLCLSFISFANKPLLAAEKILISCECIQTSPAGLCSLNVFDKKAESPRYHWTNELYKPSNRNISHLDLAKSCYRKRNVDTHGAGMCCDVLSPTDENIQEKFLGKIIN